PSNRGLLMECLRDPVFRAGEALIPFLGERGDSLRQALAQREQALRALCFAAVWCAQAPAGPRALAAPFPRTMRLRHRGELIDASVHEAAPHGLQLTMGDARIDVGIAHEPLRLTADCVVHPLAIVRHDTG